MYTELEDLLHHVIEDEYAEDHLAAQDEIVPDRDVSDQLDRPYLVGRDRSSGCWEFNDQSGGEKIKKILINFGNSTTNLGEKRQKKSKKPWEFNYQSGREKIF